MAGHDDTGTSAAASSIPVDGAVGAGEFGGGFAAEAVAPAWLSKSSTHSRLFSIRVLSKDERDKVCMGEIESAGKFCVDPECIIESHKERKVHFIPPATSASDKYVFVAALSETMLLKDWCLPVEEFDNLDLYINTTRMWLEWEILFRELGERSSASSGVVGADKLAEVVRVAK